MKLTDCKPGMLVWWYCGEEAYSVEIVRQCKARVKVRVIGGQWTYVDPKNLYPRMK